MPKQKDISQAAALLIGVYGEHAMDYATARIEILAQERKPAEMDIWTRIAERIWEMYTPEFVGGPQH